MELDIENRLRNEIAVMIIFPYVAYLIAEGLELSGIVSILSNGILLSQYAKPNLRARTQTSLKFLYETAAYVSESMVFVFLGMGMFAFDHPYS